MAYSITNTRAIMQFCIKKSSSLIRCFIGSAGKVAFTGIRCREGVFASRKKSSRGRFTTDSWKTASEERVYHQCIWGLYMGFTVPVQRKLL